MAGLPPYHPPIKRQAQQPERHAKIIAAQTKFATKTPEDYFKLGIIEKNVDEQIAIIHSMASVNDELVGGEYLVRLNLSELPYNPVKFTFLTPNGIYNINEKVCIHIGEYHSQNYVQTLGLRGFTNELANGMISYRNLTPGLNIVASKSEENIRRLARASRLYNLSHHLNLVEIVENCYEMYHKKWPNYEKFSQVSPTVAELRALAKDSIEKKDQQNVMKSIANFSKQLDTTEQGIIKILDKLIPL